MRSKKWILTLVMSMAALCFGAAGVTAYGARAERTVSGGGEKIEASVAYTPAKLTYDFGYTGSVQSLTGLPAGKYKLEVWGASGGSCNGNPIGLGGYSFGEINLTATTNFYVFVGGAGGNAPNAVGASASGGFNGGGAANNTAGNGHLGAGGGGATDFRTVGGAWNNASGLNSRIIVAGGGGGAASVCGTNQQSAGHAGGITGISSKNSSSTYGVYYSTGGTQTAGGTGRSGWATGGFGYGAAGTTCGAGGGGGWYGGGAAYTACGGGGSGYLSSSIISGKLYAGGDGYIGTNFSTRVTSEAFPKPEGGTEKGHTGNGYARLTVLNSPPMVNETTEGSAYRGEETGEYKVNLLAKDPDAGDSIHLVGDGNIRNTVYFTEEGGASEGGESVDAYLSMASFNGAVNGGFVVRPERAFGKKTFYARVTDNHGHESYIPFVVNAQDRGMSFVTNREGTVRVGLSDGNDESAINNGSGYIYNAKGSGKKTVFVPKPIIQDQAGSTANSVEIRAEDIYTDGDGYDKVLIKSVTGSETNFYRITYLDPYEGLGYGGIRITATDKATTAAYISTVIQMISVEKTTKRTLESMTGAEAPDLIFKISNTRPYFAGAESVGSLPGDVQAGLGVPFYRGKVGETGRITLDSFVYDVDRNELAITGVKVPEREYVLVTKENAALAMRSEAYQVAGNGAAPDSYLTGEGTTATGFERSAVYEQGTEAGNGYVSYTVSARGEYIEFTGRSATRSMYADAAGRLGHFYVLVRVSDSGDPEDGGIWYPVAIEIENSAPESPAVKAVTEGPAGSGAIYTPMSVGGRPLGGVSAGDFDAGNMARGMAFDADTFAMQAAGLPENKPHMSPVSEFVLLKTEIKNGRRVPVLTDTAGYEFYEAEAVPLYVTSSVVSELYERTGAKAVFDAWAASGDIGWLSADGSASSEYAADGYMMFYGLKVTPVKSTGGLYFRFRAQLMDTRGSGEAAMLVRTENAAPELRSEINGIGKGELVTESTPKVVYRLKAGDEIQITPYDLVKDADTAAGINEGGFNSNPSNAGFGFVREAVNRPVSVSASERAGDEATEREFLRDRLSYNFTAQSTSNVELRMDGSTYGMDALSVKALARTLKTNPVRISAVITDGSASVSVVIEFHVENSKPRLKASAAVPFKLTASTEGTNATESEPVNGLQPNAAGYNVREFLIGELVEDGDNLDLASFYSTEVRVVTRTGSGWSEVVSIGGKEARADSYVKAAITTGTGNRFGNQVVRVEAVSSTQRVPGGIHVLFMATDRYGTDAESVSEIAFQVEVMNTVAELGEGFKAEGEQLTWEITPVNGKDVGSARYLTSDERVSELLGKDRAHARVLVSDDDGLDKVMLYAPNKGTPEALSVAEAETVDFGTFAFEAGVAVAYDNPYESASDKLDEGFLKLHFYAESENGLKEVAAAADAEHWAIEIAPASGKTMKELTIRVRVRDSSDTKGEATGYDGSRETGVVVEGVTELTLVIRVNSLGIINNHTVYRSTMAEYNNYMLSENHKTVDYDAFGTWYFVTDENGVKHYPTESGAWDAFEYGGVSVGEAATVTLPVSFFAMPASLPAKPASGNPEEYVDFATLTGDRVTGNVTLSDGKTEWKGAELSKNPYLTIGYTGQVCGDENEYQTQDYTNRNLAQWNNGALEKAASGYGTHYEDNIGLTLKKKNLRTGSALKLSVEVMLYDKDGKGKSKKETVTVEVRVANTRMYVTGDAERTLTSFSVSDGDQYVKLTDGQSIGAANWITYNANDGAKTGQTGYGSEAYTEKAYFLLGSIGGGDEKVRLTTEELARITDKNNSGSGEAALNRYSGGEALTTEFKPNEHYRKYFKIAEVESAGSDGQTLTIQPVSKTQISEAVIRSEAAAVKTAEPGLTDAEARARALASRGLVEENGKIVYPLRVIVYDSFGGTGWEAASYEALVLKVHIGNSAPSLRPGAGSADAYSVRVPSTGAPLSIRLSDLMTDADFKLSAAGERYLSKTEVEALSADERAGLDWPEVSVGAVTGENLTPEALEEAKGVVSLTADGESITLTASKRVKGTLIYEVKISDVSDAAALSTLTLKIRAEVDNSAPVVSDKVIQQNVTMRTGDSFTVLASEYSAAAFGTYPKFDSVYAAGKETFDYKTAASVPFEFSAGGTGEAKHLGYLPLTSDDDARSLRFTATTDASGRLVEGNPLSGEDLAAEYFTPRLEYLTERDYDGVKRPMAMTFTANRVCTGVNFSFEVEDGDGARVRVTLKVTVVSRPPELYTRSDLVGGVLPHNERLTVETGDSGEVFALRMKRGESVALTMTDFAADPDPDDDANMTILKSGTRGVSLDGAEKSAYLDIEEGNSGFTLSATNPVTESGKQYVEVTFAVLDSNRTDSVPVTLRVYLAPHEMTAAGSVSGVPFTVKSRAAYLETLTPSTLTVVEQEGKYISDLDCGASRAAYNLKIYALAKVVDGTLTPLSYKDTEVYMTGGEISGDYLILSREDGSETTTPSAEGLKNAVFRYVTMTTKGDGTAIVMEPKLRTKSPIPLIITATKRLAADAAKVSASVRVPLSVQNSAPVATENSESNYDPDRGEAFLSFTGTAGSEREYVLADPAAPYYGLFEEYDAAAGDKVSFVRYSVDETYELGGKTYRTDPGWQKNASGVYAFTLTAEENKIKLRVNRRIEGPSPVYYVPVRVVCEDGSRERSETVILLGIRNSAPTLKTVSDPTKEYSVTSEGGSFVLSARIEYGKAISIPLSELIDDKDYDVDSYTFAPCGMTGDLSAIDRDPTRALSVATGGKELFKIMTSEDNKLLTIRATSKDRGAVGEAYLVVADSSDTEEAYSRTETLRFMLEVGNTAPTVRPDAPAEQSLMGGGEEKTLTFNLLDYVTDINPGDAVAGGGTSRTYLTVKSITTREPEVLEGELVPPVGQPILSVIKECRISEEAEAYEQSFYAVTYPNVYGKQVITVTASDGGGRDGDDGMQLTVTFDITVYVARPADALNTLDIPWKKSLDVTPELLLATESSPNAHLGYAIESMTVAPGYENFVTVEEGTTRVTARGKDSKDNVVNVVLTAGAERKALSFRVNVTENYKPVLALLPEEPFETDRLGEGNLVKLRPEQIFTDPEGDAMTLQSAKSQKSVIVSASVDRSANLLLLKFKASGKSVITVTVSDATGQVYPYTFTATNSSLKAPSFFGSIVARIQSRPWFFLILAGAALLLLLIILLIVIAVHRKKKMRREIEALLSSEMELEEQMLRLSASPNQTFYQSYGYLPPTQQIQTNPGFMLGDGRDISSETAIGLNPGQDDKPDDFNNF